MNNLKFLSTTKVFLSAILFLSSLNGFAQSNDNTQTPQRATVHFKQQHSSELKNQGQLYADGIKLKMDLSALEKAQAEREEFDPNEIPADDVYGGQWSNSYVNAYRNLKNAPESFVVDLSNFTMPCNGHMTSNFGRRGGRRYHYGIDLKAYTGDTIYAAFDGKIRVKAYEGKGYGYYLVIRHVNGLETVYGHLSKFLVKENQFVKSGEPIGLAGNTGRSSGSHLHFETRFLGQAINPNFIIDFKNKTCHKDEYVVTRNSYRKTSNSSSNVLDMPKVAGPNYVKSTNSTNKYVSGSVKYHRVRKGDTLSAISKRYGVSVKRLCSLNNMTTRTKLRTGKSIRIS